ncbi:MAG TPA: class I SAM-dependent methyltransferase [Gaiellaceae bacterium]|nr:class I SAM-dependent methyltransferase [Gaiellaceae bacterium]
MTFNEDWEREALNWAAWARTPGHDSYWIYSPMFFELVPKPGRATLEIGCGEGRVTRDLKERGHQVVAVDASPTLVRLAQEKDPDGEYLLADAAALPFEDAAFDLVVSYNSLMDIQDMPSAVREAGRVLEPEGCFCACVTHPLMDAGRFVSHDPGAAFVIAGSYFGRRRFEGTFERDGLAVTFHGWCYPLEDYARALEDAGLLIEALREPPIPSEVVTAKPREEPHSRIPMFLHLRAVKP